MVDKPAFEDKTFATSSRVVDVLDGDSVRDSRYASTSTRKGQEKAAFSGLSAFGLSFAVL